MTWCPRREVRDTWSCRMDRGVEGSSGLFLISAFLPLEINSCLIRHGGCHVHADCIPTGPQQVS